MKTFLRTGAAALILVLAACAGTSSLDMGVLNGAEINNFRAPEAEVLSTGQPTADQLRVMASAGVKHIIYLRGLGEDAGITRDDLSQYSGVCRRWRLKRR